MTAHLISLSSRLQKRRHTVSTNTWNLNADLQRQVLAIASGFCSSERWRTEHDAAMRARDIEDAVAMGNAVFEYLQGREIRAYECAAEAELADVDLQFGTLYTQWHASAVCVLKEAEASISKGYDIAGLATLRSAISQAAPHAEAFNPPSHLQPTSESSPVAAPPAWLEDGEDWVSNLGERQIETCRL